MGGVVKDIVALNIEIEIREPRRKMQTKDVEKFKVQLTNRRIEILEPDEALTGPDKLFGPFNADHLFYVIVTCLGICCLCLCSVCVICYKWQARRIERQCE